MVKMPKSGDKNEGRRKPGGGRQRPAAASAKEARADKVDARMDARAEKKEARKEARAEKVPLRVPAGTPVTVRTNDTVKIENAQIGDTCRATVAYDVRANDEVAIPAGARATISMVQVERGDELGMRLKSIDINGRSKPVKSDFARVEGDKDGMGMLGKAAIGAALGGIAGGGTGAAAGAAGGVGLGALFGPDKEVPSGTSLTFDLREPVNIGQ
jgi:hypothetical protein